MGTVIQMFASAVPADGMASIDVPHDGRLVGVDWAIKSAFAGADGAQDIQLSFGSVNQLLINDTRSVISARALIHDFTTSGAAMTNINVFVKLPDIQVGMGERIFLHATGTAVVVVIKCCLHFDFELDRALARRR